MRRLASISLVFAAVVAMYGQQTFSAPLSVEQNDWVVLSTGGGAVQYGDGGEFRVDVYGPNAFNSTDGSPNSQYTNGILGTFYTFCGDTAHVFVPGNAYEVSSVGAAPPTMSALGQSLFYQYWNNSDTTVPSDLSGYVPGHNALAANSTIGGILNTSVAGALQAEIWASLGETWSAGYDWSGQVAAAEGVFQWAENLVAVPDNTIDQLSLWGPNNNYGYGNPAQAQMYVPSEIGHVVGVFVPEPSSLVLLGVGAVSLIAYAWRKRRQAA
jgi:hypothetical protein